MGVRSMPVGRAVLSRMWVGPMVEMLIVAALYWAGARLGLRLAFANRNVTAVWPPTGISVAALFVLGSRLWPGVLAGALLANLTNGAALDTAAGIAVGNTLAPLLAAHLLRRIGFHAAIDRVVDVVSIVGVGLLCMLVSATLGSTVLLLTDALNGSYGSAWTVWWIGDAMGVIVFAPALLTLATVRRPTSIRRARVAEIAAFLALTPVATFFFIASTVPLWYMVIPFALWGALRFRQPVAAVTVAVVSSVSVVVMVNDLGPYTTLSVTTRLVTLQVFNATLALTVMLLTALADERSRAWSALQAAALDLEESVRVRSEELLVAQGAAAEASERDARNLRTVVERITNLESMKSDFLRLASHELRGPIGIVRGYLEMLADGTFGEVPPAMRQALSIVDDKAAQMSRLIDQMLETARLEKEQPASNKRLVDLADVLRRVVGAAEAVGQPGHTFLIEDAAGTALTLGDPDQITTIVRNLVDNAVRYSPGGGEIRVRLDACDGVVAVAVTDQGIGIAPDDVGRLFLSFSRIVTEENARIPGTGLGLHISKKLALLHGGDLSVSSSPGAGSTFTLTLPLAT